MFDNNKLIIFSCSTAILLSLFSSFSSFVILIFLLILILILYLIYGSKVILPIIIIGYLAAPSDFLGGFRVYLNLFLTSLLILLFIKEFGLQFNNYPKLPKEILIFILALFLTLFISTIFSNDRGTGFFTIVTMFTFFIISYMFFAFLQDVKNIFIYIYSIFTAVIFLSIRMFLDLYALGFQDFLVRSLLQDKIELYSSSLYTGSVIFFISITLSTAMILINNFKRKIYKYIITFFFAINIVILILANSRGLIVAALLSTSFMLLVFKRTSFFKILFTFVVVGVILLFSVPAIEDAFNLYSRTGTTHREVFWEAGVEIMEDYPLAGTGPQSFAKYFYSYAPSSVFAFKEWKAGNHTPHNFFLYYAAENGILGLFIGVSLFILFFYFAGKTMKLSRNNKQYFILSTAITGIGIGFFIRSFVEVTGFLFYGFITTDLPFWLIFGILIFLYQKLNVTNIKLTSTGN